jgi:two-component system sensor histidine kinase KdpD
MPDDQTDDLRPSPEALLDAARRETRGRLRIFLGAAPGVGKTWEMLVAGRAQRMDGVDVVIGIVETHGRAETAALVDGFEIIPRRWVDHRGRRLEEMDIDAILSRRPRLVLVDELAHSNVAGSRHPKRYLDVEELLAHGIDVYSTLNIQHVESLNDVVAQITGVRVRETVPDFVIDRADEVEVVDLTPDDLIKRLREGKVYLPTTAARAVDNFFTPGNLTALRELALRRTAQRVDDQLVNHMQAHAISGPWAAGERVLVAVDERPRSASLVRHARRQAERLRAPWMAIHIDSARAADMGEPAKDRLAAHLRLAGELGGEVASVPGHDVAAELLRFAKAGNYTHIIVGSPHKSRWEEIFSGSVAHDLIRNAGDISIHVIAGSEREGESERKVATAKPSAGFDPRPYAVSTLYVLATLGVGVVLDRFLDVRNLALVFLMAVLGAAVSYGLGPALYASVASALAFNFFFLDPRYTLTIRDPESVVALSMFFLVAVTASNLAARLHRQAASARQRARMTEDLYQFSRKLAGTGTLDDVLWATAYQIAAMLRVEVVILLPEGDTLAVKAGYPPDDTLSEADIAAASWAFAQERPAGRGADTLPGATRLYLPFRTGRMKIGVIGLFSQKPGPLLTPSDQRLFNALADQAAVAVERIQLVADVERARLVTEADRLRAALLSSISHDLKTPLAGILGAAGTLRDYMPALPEADRGELVTTIVEESERLNRFIGNLLDMTRLESGAIRLNASLQFPGDIVGSALRRASRLLVGHPLSVSLPADLPMLKVDAVLLEQVLFNLLDNAGKYAPTGSSIAIDGWREGGHVLLRVIDEGPGIPPADLERVFDSFYRVGKTDQVQAGTGLGLAICRGFVEAMGGTIIAGNRADRSGAVFTLRLPVPPEAGAGESLP